MENEGLRDISSLISRCVLHTWNFRFLTVVTLPEEVTDLSCILELLDLFRSGAHDSFVFSHS